MLLLVLVLAGLGAGSLYSLTRPVLYRATAMGYVVAGNSTTVGDAFSGSALASQRASAYVPLVTTRAVAQRVINELKLDASAAGLAGQLEGSVVEGTALFNVSAVSDTPESAQTLADAALRATAAEALSLETMTSRGSTSVVRLVPKATALLPGAPFSPNWRYNLMLGALAGFALGLLIAFIRRSIDGRIHESAQVEEITGGSVLGVIPRTTELGTQRESKTTDMGVAAESLRQLRTNLRYVSVDRRPKSIVITSASPGEGKSTVSTNLARLLAESGQPTVLVDADLRRPMQSRVFDVDGSVGLSQVLAEDIPVADVLQASDTDGLMVLPAGRIPPNPSELLGSQRMQSLIEELERDYTVIIDAPPLLPVTDAGLVTAAADGALLVLQVGKTHREQVRVCTKIFQQVQGRLLGSVLNMAPKSGIGSVIYGYGYGGYKQSYYYYSQDKARKGGLLGWLPAKRVRASKPKPSEPAVDEAAKAKESASA